MVSLYGEDGLAAAALGGVEYDVLGNVAAEKQQIRTSDDFVILRNGKVGNHADIHGIFHRPVADSLERIQGEAAGQVPGSGGQAEIMCQKQNMVAEEGIEPPARGL